MGDQLVNQLRNACCQLEDKLVTARTKAAQELRYLLTNPRLLAQLDKSGSIQSEPGDWNWQDVYRSTVAYLKKDEDKIAVDSTKEKQAKSAESSRRVKRRELSAILRLVIRRGRNHLSWDKVVTDLLNMIHNPCLRPHYCPDFVRLLVDSLTDSKARSMLRPHDERTRDPGHWYRIISVVKELVDEAPPGLDSLSLAQLIHQAFLQGSKFTDMTSILIRPDTWRLVRKLLLAPDSFARPDSEARLEVIRAVNCLLWRVGLDCRVEACKLGEETVQAVIRSWSDRKDGDVSPVVEFLRLQMSLHHPGGSTEGEMVLERDIWTRQLARIYHNVVEITVKNRVRWCKSRGSRLATEYQLGLNILNLAVEVVRQLLSCGGNVEMSDVTQLVSLDTPQGAPLAKRRRFSSDENQNGEKSRFSLQILLDELLAPSEHNQESKIPWLQIIGGLISKYPDCLTDDQRGGLLHVLSSLLQVTRSVAVRRNILLVSTSLLEVTIGPVVGTDWELFGRTAVNMLTMNQAGEEGHIFLRSALDKSLVLANQVYQAYSNRLVKRSLESLQTISYLLSRHPLQEKEHGKTNRGNVSRQNLIIWLLPNEDQEEKRDIWGKEAAKVLELSVLKRVVAVDFTLRKQMENCAYREFENHLLYLSGVNNIMTGLPSKSSNAVDSNLPRAILLDDLAENVESLLVQEAAELMDQLNAAPNQTQYVTEAVNQAYTIFVYLSGIGKDSTTSKLANTSRRLLIKAGEASTKTLGRKGVKSSEMKVFLKHWLTLLDHRNSLMSTPFLQMVRMSSSLSSSLLDRLEELVSEMCSKKEQKSIELNPSPMSQKNDGGGDRDPFDDLDDFDTNNLTSKENINVDDIDNTKDPKSDTTDLHLASICLSILSSVSVGNSDEVETRQARVVELLNQVLKSYCYDEECLAIVPEVVEWLVGCTDSPMTPSAVKEIIGLIRGLAKHCMTRILFNCQGVLVLVRLLTILAPTFNDNEMVDSNRRDYLQIIHVMAKQNQLASLTRLGPDIMVEMIQLKGKLRSLGSKWAVWSQHNSVALLDSSLDIDTDLDQPVGQCLSRFLASQSVVLRLEAAKQLLLLNSNIKLEVFNRELIPAVTVSLKKQKESTLIELSQTGTVCAFLCSLSKSNPDLALPVLTCLVKLSMKDQTDEGRINIERSLLTKAVSLVVKNSNTEKTNILEQFLPGLLEGYSGDLDAFPCYLLGHEDIKDFVNNHEADIASWALLRVPTLEMLTNLGEILNKEPMEVVLDNFVTLTLFFLPGLANQGQDKENKKMIKLANFVQSLLKDKFGEKVLKCSPNVISKMYSCINDPKEMARIFGLQNVNQVVGNPPNLDSGTLEKVITLLDGIVSDGGLSFWQFLSKHKSESIARIAVTLVSSLSESQSLPRSLFSLYQWLESLSTSSNNEMFHILPFLVNYITTSLLSLLNTTQSQFQVTTSILIVVNKLTNLALSQDPSSLDPIFFSLTYCCVSLASNDSCKEGGKEAIDILNTLFIKNDFHFKSHLKKIEPFPAEPQFLRLKTATDPEIQEEHRDLEKWIENFLEIELVTQPDFMMIPLKALRSKLKENNDDFIRLLNLPDIVRKLLVVLVKISKTSCKAVSQEALLCLGEVGPLDLNSPVLTPEHQVSLTSQYALVPAMKYVKKILVTLQDILVSKKGVSSRRAAQAITNILSYTKEGQEFITPSPGSEHTELQSLLAPLQKAVKKTQSIKPDIDMTLYLTSIDNPSVWSGDQQIGHEDWITHLVSTLLGYFKEDSVLYYLTSTCALSTNLCEIVFPFIIHELLLIDNNDLRLVLSSKFSKFFQDHFLSVRGNTNPCSRAGTPLVTGVTNMTESTAYLRTESIRCMLAVVSHLRYQPLAPHIKANVREQNCWENNNWIAQLSFLHCAQAALSCCAYFSASQFGSIWCYQAQDRIPTLRESDHLEGSILDNLSPYYIDESEAVQNILYQSYLHLGDKDAAVGSVRSSLTKPTTRTAQLAMDNSLSALPLYDSQTRAVELGAKEGLLQTLYNSGMHLTLSKYLSTLDNEDMDQLQEFQQECNWRLGHWDKFNPEQSLNSFHGCVLGGMESAIRGDTGAVNYWCTAGRDRVATMLQATSLETSTGLYPFLTQLKQLSELHKLAGVIHTVNSLNTVLDSLVIKDDCKWSDFRLFEPVLTQRQLLLSTNKWSGGAVRNMVKLRLDDMCNHVSKLSRIAGEFWVCNQQQCFITEQTLSSRHEEALVTWAQDQHETAIILAKRLLRDIDSQDQIRPEAAELKPRLLLNLGQWLNASNSEPSSVILNSYLVKAVEQQESGPELIGAHMAVASFADSQYKQVKDYINSAEFQERMGNIESNRKEAEILTEDKVKDIKTAGIVKQRFSNLDEQERDGCLLQAEEYLSTAIQHYLTVLEGVSDIKPMAVYRLVALWFSNMDTKCVLDLLEANLSRIPSYKFVPLLYQMAARMDIPKKNGANSVTLLFKLLLRCATDHPHHAIPICMALAHAKEDEKQVQNKTVTKEKNNVGDDTREKAAEQLMALLEKKPDKAETVERYRFMLKGLIHLAYVEPPSKSMKDIPFPSNQQLRKVDRWNEVSVPTDTVSVRPDGDYSRVCGIDRWITSYTMVGGVNAPKKLSCLGTDGRLRLQLVKGKDDLRQDAVMEQVFGLTNQLLDRTEVTRKRGLNVRTYKVVPLSQRSGVLEWCVNTLPLAAYLVGPDQKSGAHKHYHPRQWSSSECRAKMASLKTKVAGKVHPLKAREATFRDVCCNFSPAMRFFFFEKFPAPGSFHIARSAYIKSVATNSMVGHILGLGDRHTNNILIDQSNGELVHIDLGVAFEQGKILPTPEKIPFRLTRDIIDGMGPTGVEGVFRRSCEASMGVLRDNKDALLTVLEVLLHDPLYNWSVGPGKAAAKQEQGRWQELKKQQAGQGNIMASRALLVLAAKLDGREDGATLSVRGQVSTLINRASDPSNLCQVFEGWAPWC